MAEDALSISIDFSELEKAIEKQEEIPRHLQQVMTDAMEQSLLLVKGQVVVGTPTNVGTLRASISHEIISAFPNLVGRVGSPQPYAIVIEKGRAPGSRMPPVDAIKLWVIRKLQLPPEEVEGAAWAIAKHIAKHGFSTKGDVGPKGARMFEKGMEASEPHVVTIFDKAIKRMVDIYG